MRFAVCLVAVLAACYGPDFDQKRFQCATFNECPDGYACINRCCGGRCPSCIYSLSGIGAADFTIGFRVVTTSTTASTILFQRAACDSGDFWDVQLAPEGRLKIKLSDKAGAMTTLTAAAIVNDGRRHEATFQRTAGVLSVWVDGAQVGTAPAPQVFGSLPALGVAAGDPCIGPLAGAVSDVCLTTQ